MNEYEFGYRIRQALNEAAERLDPTIVLRLQQARSAALARHRARSGATVPRIAPRPAPEFGFGWLRMAGLAAPVLALVIGFVAIYQWQHQKHIAELADLDFAVLMDPAPIDTYADKSFGVLLRAEDI